MKTLFLISITFFSAVSQAQTTLTKSQQDKIDSVFIECNLKTAGCAVSVMKDNAVLFEKGYGLENLESNSPITPTTNFETGSTSKHFTTYCIWLLNQQGKLKIDDEIQKYIPELPAFNYPVTIRHCLYSTSGLREYRRLMMLKNIDDDHQTDTNVLEQLKKNNKLNFMPGEYYQHCNTNYFVLATIVERVSGQSLRDFAKENIFVPLKMDNTSFKDEKPLPFQNIAIGYSKINGKLEQTVSSNTMDGAKGLYSNLKDLQKWHNYLLQKGNPLVDSLTKQGTFNDGSKMNFASAIITEKYKGEKVIWVNGGFTGYVSQLILFPYRNLSIIWLSNNSEFDKYAYSLGFTIADIIVSLKPGDYFPTEITLDKKTLQNHQGSYFDKDRNCLLTVSAKDNRLMINYFSEEGTEELIPISADKFVSAKRQDKIFMFSANHLIVSVDGNKRKSYFKQSAPSTADNSVIGKYKCDEFDMVCTITQTKKGLFINQNKDSTPLTLFSAGSYAIAGERAVLILTRNADKTVNGFNVHYFDLQNLQFSKEK